MGPCCNADFRIVLNDNFTEVGVIQKKAALREMISDANTFGVSFPVQLEPKFKALILAAVFVIVRISPNHSMNQFQTKTILVELTFYFHFEQDFGYFEAAAQPNRGGYHHHHY